MIPCTGFPGCRRRRHTLTARALASHHPHSLPEPPRASKSRNGKREAWEDSSKAIQVASATTFSRSTSPGFVTCPALGASDITSSIDPKQLGHKMNLLSKFSRSRQPLHKQPASLGIVLRCQASFRILRLNRRHCKMTCMRACVCACRVQACMDAWMDGWMDGWLAGWLAGR